MENKEQARRFLSSRIEANWRHLLSSPKDLEGIVDSETIQKSLESIKRELDMFIHLYKLNEEA